MSGRKQGLSASEEAAFDRIEDRLRDAEIGFHDVGAPASTTALAESGLDDEAQTVWARWDGVELAAGDARLLPLAEHATATAEALAEGRIREGDRVIGERGRDLMVLPQDPWAEGGAVIRVEEAGDRTPDASSVRSLLMGWLGELSVLYDEHGEFHDEIFGEDGELNVAVERRLCRRRLDYDPDAVGARLRLAELLRGAGELAAAKAELNQVIKRAPDFPWGHFALGRTLASLGQPARAIASYRAAAAVQPDAVVGAWYLAWAALVAEGGARESLVAEVLAARPSFGSQQAQAVASLLEDGRVVDAREHLELGLAVAPTNLELLRLRGEIDQLPEDGGVDGGDDGDAEIEDGLDGDLDDLDAEIANEEAMAAEELRNDGLLEGGAPKKKRGK